MYLKSKMKISAALTVVFLCVSSIGCGSRIIKTDGDGPPVYRMDDGSACKAPAGYPEILEAPGTRRVQTLFETLTLPRIASAYARDLPSFDELDAALYLSCGEYASGELSKDQFRSHRIIFQEVRVRLLQLGIRDWLDDPEGFDKAGKVCHLMFKGRDPSPRNLTRWVPEETTADDCAAFIFKNDGSHVLLGCTAGNWDITWASQPILAGPSGWVNRRRSLAGTQYVPVPDCGWGRSSN